jgi:hypothetical protein
MGGLLPLQYGSLALNLSEKDYTIGNGIRQERKRLFPPVFSGRRGSLPLHGHPKNAHIQAGETLNPGLTVQGADAIMKPR